MSKLPSFQFYPGDWLKDPALIVCSPSTRGIWIDFLCVMHELDHCGVIAGTREQLARLGRCSIVQLDHALSELSTFKTAEVTERNNLVTVTNRRMQREYKERISNVLRQRKFKSNAKSNVKVTSYSSSSSSISIKENIKEKAATDVAFFPEKFSGDEFKKLWGLWEKHCREKGKPIRPTQRDCQLMQLMHYSLEDAMSTLRQSIANGWVNLFELKELQGVMKTKEKPVQHFKNPADDSVYYEKPEIKNKFSDEEYHNTTGQERSEQ